MTFLDIVLRVASCWWLSGLMGLLLMAADGCKFALKDYAVGVLAGPLTLAIALSARGGSK